MRVRKAWSRIERQAMAPRLGPSRWPEIEWRCVSWRYMGRRACPEILSTSAVNGMAAEDSVGRRQEANMG